METRGMKTVYTVIDRGNGKSFWMKLGVGFVNRDGSINIRLDAHPTNGTLQIRDYEPPRAQTASEVHTDTANPTAQETLLG
jgi:hypothetical protein